VNRSARESGAKKLRRKRASLREISAALAKAGFVNVNGAPYAAMSVRNMLAQ
jgi:hypothetical protein